MKELEDITITKQEARCLGILDGLGFVQKDVYKRINKQILDLIESGKDLPWRKPWRDGYKFKGVVYGPQNYVTGNPYRGANAYTIFLYNLKTGRNSELFLSKKQIADRGGKLKPGAQPIDVFAFIKGTEVKKTREGKEVEIEKKGIIFYEVYDLVDTEGVKPIKRKTIKTDEKHEVIVLPQTVIDGMPKRPVIKNDGGNRAYYSSYSDSVHMPVQKAFEKKEEYYSTLFHELVHSTGHEKRLKRVFGKKFGDKTYAFEELIAEVGSAYLCGVTNIDYYTLKNAAAYLKSWASNLKSEIAQDKTFLFRAILKATKAAKFIIGTTLTKEGEKVPEGSKTSQVEEKPHPGKELTPNKKIKASVSAAIDDLLTLPKYKQIGAMAMQMLYSSQNNNNFPSDNEGLKGKIFEKLENQGYANYTGDTYELTDEGMKVFEAIQGRLDTLKAKKGGSDLFPDLAGATGSEDMVKAYLAFHNKTVLVSDVRDYIQTLHNLIKAGDIKKTDPLIKYIREIQNKMVRVFNACHAGKRVKIVIGNYEEMTGELRGLGFIPEMVGAAIGAAVQKLTKHHMTKEPGVSGVEVEKNEGGFVRADQKEKVKAPDTFQLPGEVGKLLQDIQPFKYSIVLTGDPHAGKTEFVWQLADAFASTGRQVGVFSLEQGGMESKDTREGVARNIQPENEKNVSITGRAANGIETVKKFAKNFDVVVIDSWQKLGIPATQFDSLRIEYPGTIWVVIFQQTVNGKTRGGASADFDSPVHLKVHRVDHTFKNNYVELVKNRGNSLEYQYLIKAKKTVSLNDKK